MRRRALNCFALRSAMLVVAAALAVLLAVTAVFDARAAASGWLVGFAFCAQVLIGNLTLVMIYRLTAGRWGEIIAPVTGPTAAAVPVLLLLAIPLFVAMPALYPWLHHAVPIKPDVLSYYLNAPSFIVRSVLALVGWSALAWSLPRFDGRHGQLLAALGLVFHALVISSVSIDWYLSLAAPFTSSSFGASVAISSLVAASAWAALLAPSCGDDPAIGDVGGLLLATILGITYIDFMAVLVIWYGDLPYEEIWFVQRDFMPWTALAIASFVLVSLGPILALLLARVRNAQIPLRVVGGCVLAGLACYDTYLIAPPAGPLALVASFIAVVALVLTLLGLLMGNAAALSSGESIDAR
jgi:hypothetical protein